MRGGTMSKVKGGGPLMGVQTVVEVGSRRRKNLTVVGLARGWEMKLGFWVRKYI